jgi:hypothetical protein
MYLCGLRGGSWVREGSGARGVVVAGAFRVGCCVGDFTACSGGTAQICEAGH